MCCYREYVFLFLLFPRFDEYIGFFFLSKKRQFCSSSFVNHFRRVVLSLGSFTVGAIFLPDWRQMTERSNFRASSKICMFIKGQIITSVNDSLRVVWIRKKMLEKNEKIAMCVSLFEDTRRGQLV